MPRTRAQVARHWYERSWQRTLAEIPDELRDRREDPQLFIEILDHWHWLSESQGRDVDLWDAAADYATTVLPFEPAEAIVAVPDPDDDDTNDPGDER